MKALFESKWLYITAFLFTFLGAALDSIVERFNIKKTLNIDGDSAELSYSIIPSPKNIDTIFVTFNDGNFRFSKHYFTGSIVCFVSNHSMGDVRYRIYVKGRADWLLHELLVREKDVGAWFELRYRKSITHYAVHLQSIDYKGREINTRIVIHQRDLL
jgi:hypothetical protein